MLHTYTAAGATLIVLCFATWLSASDAPFVTPKNTEEVRFVFRAGEGGQVATNLAASDFAVVDSGNIARSFKSFRRISDVPVRLVLVVDNSASILCLLHKKKEAVCRFLENLIRPGVDSVAIVTFVQSHPHVALGLTSDVQQAVEVLAKIAAAGETPLYYAITEAVAIASQNYDLETRTALFVFSDGEDTINIHSLGDPIDSALASEVTIYAIDLSDPRYLSRGASAMTRMSRDTGGQIFQLADLHSDTLQHLAAELHTYYAVSYAPPVVRWQLHSLSTYPTHNVRLCFRCRTRYYRPELCEGSGLVKMEGK